MAIIYGIKKFHMYLFGRHFEILCDHKPLQHMFHASKGTPTMITKMVNRTGSIRLHTSLQTRSKPRQCRHAQSSTSRPSTYHSSRANGTHLTDGDVVYNSPDSSANQAKGSRHRQGDGLSYMEYNTPTRLNSNLTTTERKNCLSTMDVYYGVAELSYHQQDDRKHWS